MAQKQSTSSARDHYGARPPRPRRIVLFTAPRLRCAHAPSPCMRLRPIPQLTAVFYASVQRSTHMEHMEAGVERCARQLGERLRSTTRTTASIGAIVLAPASLSRVASYGLCGYRRARLPASMRGGLLRRQERWLAAGCCGSVARAVGAGQRPKEAVRFGDLAPRGGRADACENVRVSRTFVAISQVGGRGAPRCQGRWRMLVYRSNGWV